MIRINLLREPARKAKAWTAEKSQLGIYAFMLFLLAFGSMGWWYWYLLSQRAEGVAVREQLRQENLRLQAVRAELQRYETQKKKLDERIAVIERLKANQTGPVLLMNAVIASVPNRPTLWLKKLDQKENVVSIEGQSFDIESISDFIANLNQNSPFKQVELNEMTQEQESIKFSLTCELSR